MLSQLTKNNDWSLFPNQLYITSYEPIYSNEFDKIYRESTAFSLTEFLFKNRKINKPFLIVHIN